MWWRRAFWVETLRQEWLGTCERIEKERGLGAGAVAMALF